MFKYRKLERNNILNFFRLSKTWKPNRYLIHFLIKSNITCLEQAALGGVQLIEGVPDRRRDVQRQGAREAEGQGSDQAQPDHEEDSSELCGRCSQRSCGRTAGYSDGGGARRPGGLSCVHGSEDERQFRTKCTSELH